MLVRRIQCFVLLVVLHRVSCEDDTIKLKEQVDEKLSMTEELANMGSSVPDDRFLHGFLASLSVIVVSELGDKTSEHNLLFQLSKLKNMICLP